MLKVIFDDKKNEKEIENEKLDVEDFIAVKGPKAKGKRLSNFAIKKVSWLQPLPYSPPRHDQEEAVEGAPGGPIEETAEETNIATETPTEETVDSKAGQKQIGSDQKDKSKPVKPPKAKGTTEKKKPDDDGPVQMSLFD